MKKNNHPVRVADKMVDYHFVLGSQINLNPVAKQLSYSRHHHFIRRSFKCQVFISPKKRVCGMSYYLRKEHFALSKRDSDRAVYHTGLKNRRNKKKRMVIVSPITTLEIIGKNYFGRKLPTTLQYSISMKIVNYFGVKKRGQPNITVPASDIVIRCQTR